MMENDENKKATAAPGRRWTRYLLVASLGVNLAIVGLVGGAFLRGGPPEHMRPPREVSLLGLRPYYRALDAESQKRLDAAIGDGVGQMRAGREAFGAHLKAMAAALAATPYDEAALKAVLDAQRGKIDANMALGRDLFLQTVRDLDDESRAALAERLTSRRARD